mmetsp:Transcript_19497/g.40174  ORF Transcript_19497/g.40174 Transcript_19497/m.40174 type:complete len:278 (-) Transcript_19497:346-1179(-)
MTKLRRDERQGAVKGNTKRHIRRSQTGSGKRRRVNPSTSTGGTGTESLPSTIHPNLIGLINITPSSKWKALKQDHRSWILSYNRAVRHKDSLPAAPPGVTVGSSIDDGENNEDKFGRSQQRTLRRMPGSGSGTPLDSTRETRKERTEPIAASEEERTIGGGALLVGTKQKQKQAYAGSKPSSNGARTGGRNHRSLSKNRSVRKRAGRGAFLLACRTEAGSNQTHPKPVGGPPPARWCGKAVAAMDGGRGQPTEQSDRGRGAAPDRNGTGGEARCRSY